MKEAFYGFDGDKVTLSQFIARQDGQTNPKKWTVRPYCASCGVEVHAHNVQGALGFPRVAREIGGQKVYPQIGFHHYAYKANGNCPSYFPNDPRFAELAKHKYDPRVRERNLEILFSPRVRAFNKAVLSALMRRLKKEKFSENDISRLEETAKAKLMTMEVLGHYPWLLPYVLARLEGHVARSTTNRTFTVTFDNVGEQSLEFTDIDGKKQSALVPQALRMCFVNRMRGGGVRLKQMEYPGTDEPMQFWLSKQDAASLAGYRLPNENARRVATKRAQRTPKNDPRQRNIPLPQPKG